jgi:inner membrane protein
MPTIISHGIFATITNRMHRRFMETQKLLWIAVLCSVLPDVDVIGFGFGIRYGDLFGHRGFTHSLLFAFVTAGTAVLIWYRQEKKRIELLIYLFLVTASHGFFDAMTDGGLGVAFFSPFNPRRYFLPWRPIRVSPIGLDFLFSRVAVDVFVSEFIYVILPALAICIALRLMFNGLRPAHSSER